MDWNPSFPISRGLDSSFTSPGGFLHLLPPTRVLRKGWLCGSSLWSSGLFRLCIFRATTRPSDHSRDTQTTPGRAVSANPFAHRGRPSFGAQLHTVHLRGPEACPGIGALLVFSPSWAHQLRESSCGPNSVTACSGPLSVLYLRCPGVLAS